MKPNHKLAGYELDIWDMKAAGSNCRKKKAYCKRLTTKKNRKHANKAMMIGE